MNISQKKLEKSKGRLEIKIKDQNLQKLYQQGSSKALMPDFHENLKQLMLINTAGGITSGCLLYTSPSPRDKRQSRMPSSA